MVGGLSIGGGNAASSIIPVCYNLIQRSPKRRKYYLKKSLLMLCMFTLQILNIWKGTQKKQRNYMNWNSIYLLLSNYDKSIVYFHFIFCFFCCCFLFYVLCVSMLVIEFSQWILLVFLFTSFYCYWGNYPLSVCCWCQNIRVFFCSFSSFFFFFTVLSGSTYLSQ